MKSPASPVSPDSPRQPLPPGPAPSGSGREAESPGIAFVSLVRRAHDHVVARTNPVLMAVAALVVYLLVNNGQYQYFNYYVHLAESFLQGKLHIENPPPWLTEFTWHDGKRYLFYGPLPAVLLMPLVALFHLKLNIAYPCIAIGALDVGLAWVLLDRLGLSRKTTFWLTLIFAFGSVHFWVSEYGNNWLFSQVVAEMFLLLGAIEALGKKRGLLVGLALGAAILTRNACMLAAPFYLVALNQPRLDGRKSGAFALGVALFLGLNAWYNWARFGNPFDNGYVAGEKALLNPPFGSFSIHYLVKMMPAYLWRGPTFIAQPPFVTLTDHGLSVFWTTPPFLYLLPAAAAFWNRRVVRDAGPAGRDGTAAATGRFENVLGRLGIPWSHRDFWLVASAWAAIVPIAFLYLCYNGDGWRQFGSRYSLDYTPFILVVLGIYFKHRLPWPIFPLAFLAFAINLYGCIWWRVLGW